MRAATHFAIQTSLGSEHSSRPTATQPVTVVSRALEWEERPHALRTDHPGRGLVVDHPVSPRCHPSRSSPTDEFSLSTCPPRRRHVPDRLSPKEQPDCHHRDERTKAIGGAQHRARSPTRSLIRRDD